MPNIRKYQVNAENRFCCPDCDKTYKSEFSASTHWRKFHKTEPITITIPDTQPRSAVMPVKSVTRQEFDELKAQYATIIEMLTSITTTHKPIVQTCEMSTQTEEEVIEVVEPVEEPQPVAEPIAEPEPVAEPVPVVEPEPVPVAEPIAEPEPIAEVQEQVKEEPKTTIPQNDVITEKYEKATNALKNHPYRDNVNGGFISPVNGKFCKKAIDLIKHVELWQDKDGKMLKPIERKKVLKDYTTFQSAYDTYKSAKAKYDRMQKQKQEPIKVEEPVVQVAEQPIEEPVQETFELSDKTKLLLECCRTINDSGFAKAYHQLNDNSKFHITKKETKKKIEDVDFITKTYSMYKDKKSAPTKLCYIREELEHIYDTLCETWADYKLSYDFEPEDLDKFDNESDWIDVCQYLVNSDNIDMFCK
jgi:hypothetical protein